jgi:hypothetical protein
MRTAYRCRAYPNDAQQRVLARTFGCVRVAWNRTLAERHRLWHAEGRSLSYAASDAALTAMKKDPGDACGAGVRHSGTSRVRPAVKQEPQPARAGIPVLRGEE